MSDTNNTQSFASLQKTVLDAFRSHGRVSVFLKTNTALTDRFVRQFALDAGIPEECALVAVGGYGRSEMFPHSDIDVLVLFPEGHGKECDEAVSRFVTALWDLGPTVGSVTRTPGEMIREAKADITVATAFLEARFLWGNRDLFESTYETFRKTLDPKAFFQSKMLEMQQRHEHYADTPYALEPNLKESPGGLRDLQVFLWCAFVAGFGHSWKDLSENGLITETEAYHLAECQHFLFDLRIRLHAMRGRHEDRLIFDVQQALAQDAGYQTALELTESEALMKRYYLNAKNIVQLNAILMQEMADRLFGNELSAAKTRAIDEDFVARGDILDIARPDLFRTDNSAVLRLFHVYAQHRELKRLSAPLLRALWHVRDELGESFRSNPKNKALFIGLLKLHYGTYHSLKNMNIWGILGRFLPVWRRIVGQMQHDLFHAYTVDQHTMRVVKFLRRFAHSSYAHEYPLCSEVMSEMTEPWRVTAAGLFHDIAKGRGGNHSELGAEEVRRFAEDFGVAKDDADYIEFLVRHHLEMSRTAQREDTTDPDVVQRFAQIVRTRDRLDGLFLLTVADIRATSPKVWNSWKMQLLTDLYLNTCRLLQAKGAVNRASVFADRQKKARVLVDAMDIPASSRDSFWKDLDIVYFLRHTPEDIAWHTGQLAWNPNVFPIVRCRSAISGSGIQVLVFVPDQQGLFARVVAYFERRGLSVLDARIHTTHSERALDTFLVQPRAAEAADISGLVSKIPGELAKWLEEQKPLPKPKTGKLSRRSRSFPITPIVDIEKSENEHRWLLQITCNDRLGLLFAIATVFSNYQLNMDTAKILTMDERVEDVFLISGDILKSEEGIVRFENDLIAAVKDAT